MRPPCSSTAPERKASQCPPLLHADVGLLELLEDPLCLPVRCRPGVGHRRALRRSRVQPRRHAAAGEHELDRIREDVEDDLTNTPLVAADAVDVGASSASWTPF
jgi:hypothetical protein